VPREPDGCQSWIPADFRPDLVRLPSRATAKVQRGGLYEEKGRRILSRIGEEVVVAPDARSWSVGRMPVEKFAPDEWHEYRVLARGNHHRHWIDGHPTAGLVDT
jgi:hypothetical protein